MNEERLRVLADDLLTALQGAASPAARVEAVLVALRRAGLMAAGSVTPLPAVNVCAFCRVTLIDPETGERRP
jgi:hypothetical protein